MLSSLQLRFLAQRLLTKTDAEASELTNVSLPAIVVWKRQPEFMRVYQRGQEAALETAQRLMLCNIGRAVERITEAMDAITSDGLPDYSIRLAAAKLMLQSQGILKERRVIEGSESSPLRVSVTADDLHEAMRKAQQEKSIIIEGIVKEITDEESN